MIPFISNAQPIYIVLIIIFLSISNNFVHARESVPVPDTVFVDMVAIDQPYMLNRLGTSKPTGMVFALKEDVVAISGSVPGVGNARLRHEKRPRPMVIRANQNQMLKIRLTNWLTPYDSATNWGTYNAEPVMAIPPPDGSPSGSSFTQKSLTYTDSTTSKYQATRDVSIFIYGMMPQDDIGSSGIWAGTNANPLAAPGQTATYTVKATQPGTFMMYSGGNNLDQVFLSGAQLTSGLFGNVTVQAVGSEWYRSQVTQEALFYATTAWVDSLSDGSWTVKKRREAGMRPREAPTTLYPVIDYEAKYPSEQTLVYNGMNPELAKVMANKYVLRLLDDNGNLLYSDLTAIITGPRSQKFQFADSIQVPATPRRTQPYREIVINYHMDTYAVQAFDVLNRGTASAGKDQWAINYGTGGIGAEIYANRIGVGPMSDCVDCAYEEFFLSSWAVGDPAMVVDVPANAQAQADKNRQIYNRLLVNQAKAPVQPDADYVYAPKATKALYPDDPSNVYHSYLGDQLIMRVNHAGMDVPHVHHQHAHQWLHTPNSDDSQTIVPGSTYNMQMVYWGSGNKNLTVGDQIFHCHFYPHFAGGMWSMWRVHDVLEAGSKLGSDGRVLNNSRAYPDGEISEGTPIPALVPMPSYAMAPVPAPVNIDAYGQVVVEKLNGEVANPGFPFFIPGKAGSRAPHPPLDFAFEVIYGDTVYLDGGLPRHLVLDGVVPWHKESSYDWTKTIDSLKAIRLPENGTQLERAAMDFHAKRTHNTPVTGLSYSSPPATGVYTTNGQPPVHGAPYAEPAVDMEGSLEVRNKRVYKAAAIQIDAVFNKKGWHYPQQRMLSLWGDVSPTVEGVRPPQPFFFRVNSDEFVEFWHTNLIPEYYEVDAFQVRTPTDIIGQHIHLVKFDVTSSDGAANGWNYEDGTFSPDLVRDRINALNSKKDLSVMSPTTNMIGVPITAVPRQPGVYNYYDRNQALRAINPNDPNSGYPTGVFGTPPPGQDWTGAQTTLQRWYADSLLNSSGVDRTLRTVFSHDHFGPSTHQQAGLYAGMLIEPANTYWFDPISGTQLGTSGDLLISTQNPVYDQLAYDYKYKKAIPRSVKTHGNNKIELLRVADGGPTTWQAIIVDSLDLSKSYREFAFEFQDIALAQFPGGIAEVNPEYPEYFDYTAAWWNGNRFDSTAYANAVAQYTGWYQTADSTFTDSEDMVSINPGKPTPSLITANGQGLYSVNYRNASIPLNVSSSFPPSGSDYGMNTLTQTAGNAGDLSYGFASLQRQDPVLNVQPSGDVSLSGLNGNTTVHFPTEALSSNMEATDPYTPLLNAYEGDKVQIRTLVGAHQNPHTFNLMGNIWYFEPSFDASGFRSTQMMGISEHFEMEFRLPNSDAPNKVDYLYQTTSSPTGLQNGNWGILRSYNSNKPIDNVMKLPPEATMTEVQDCGCTTTQEASATVFDVVAVSAKQALGAYLSYNDRMKIKGTNALMFFHKADFENQSTFDADLSAGKWDNFKIKNSVPVEPIVLRVNAGDCFKVKLYNAIDVANLGNASMPGNFKNQSKSVAATFSNIKSSSQVGMEIQKVSYNAYSSAGLRVGSSDYAKGFKPTVGPGENTSYTYYAGVWNTTGSSPVQEPVEFGTTNIVASDHLGQALYGLQGVLVVEPKDVSWVTDVDSRANASVYKTSGDLAYRESVMLFMDNIQSVKDGKGLAGAINYKSEPFQGRLGTSNFNEIDVADAMSNQLVKANPETPMPTATTGMPLRLRVAHNVGDDAGQNLVVSGHVFAEEPYADSSRLMVQYNDTTNWFGARDQISSLGSFDLLLGEAGGNAGIKGDYMYRSYNHNYYNGGIWGVMRVHNEPSSITITKVVNTGSDVVALGSTTPILSSSKPSSQTNPMPESVKRAGKGHSTVAINEVEALTGSFVLHLGSEIPADGIVVEALSSNTTVARSAYTADMLRALEVNGKLDKTLVKRVKKGKGTAEDVDVLSSFQFVIQLKN